MSESARDLEGFCMQVTEGDVPQALELFMQIRYGLKMDYHNIETGLAENGEQG